MKCPYCGSTRYKSLKAGSLCRVCDNQVRKVLGEWQTVEYHDKLKAMVSLLEDLMGCRYGPDYTLLPGDYRKEMHLAAQIAKDCGHDLDVAIYVTDESIKIFGEKFTSLTMVKWNSYKKGSYSTRIARAAHTINAKRKEQEQQERVADLAKQRKDLFGDDEVAAWT